MVGPELTSEEARFSLRRIMAVLRETDWNDAGFALVRENEMLQRLGLDILAAPGDILAADLEKLRAIVAKPCRLDRFADVAAMNDDYRGIFSALMAAAPGAKPLRALIISRLAAHAASGLHSRPDRDRAGGGA
jgi:hypothetical protein